MPEFTIEEVEGLDGVTIERLQEEAPADNTSKRRRPSSSRSTGSKRAPSKASLQGRLENMIKLLGNVVGGFDQFDGDVIKANASEIAEQLDMLSRESPAVRKFLEGALAGGAWSGVIGVVGMNVLAPIAVHHGAFPEPVNSNLAGMFGVPVRERKPKPTAAANLPDEVIFAGLRSVDEE